MKFQGRQLQEGLRGEDTWADQLMHFLPLAEFRRYMARYDGDYKVRGVSRLDQFVYLAFSQLTYRESLGAIETCLARCSPGSTISASEAAWRAAP